MQRGHNSLSWYRGLLLTRENRDMPNKYRRALVVTFASAGLVGVAFDVAGVVQYVLRNALWGGSPAAGAWLFSQGAWWLSVFATGFLIWLAMKSSDPKQPASEQLTETSAQREIE